MSYQVIAKNQQPFEPSLEFYQTFNLRTIDLFLLIFAASKQTLLFEDWGWLWINIHQVIGLNIIPLFRLLLVFCFLLSNFSFKYIIIYFEFLRWLPFNSNGLWFLKWVGYSSFYYELLFEEVDLKLAFRNWRDLDQLV